MALALRTVLDATVRAGLIDPDTAVKVRRAVQLEHADPLEAISFQGRVPAASIYQAVALDRKIEFVELDKLSPLADLFMKIPEMLATRKNILPVLADNGKVTVATSDIEALDDRQLAEALELVFEKKIVFCLAEPEDLKIAMRRLIEKRQTDKTGKPVAVPTVEDDAVALTDRIITEAYVQRASDVHIEPRENDARIRFRIDGDLRVYKQAIPYTLGLAVLSRIKVLGKLDIAETRSPQDGRFTYTLLKCQGQKIDIRLATAPTNYGERATLRILGVNTGELVLEKLGFSPAMQAAFEKIIRRPHGLVLLTGPTGSGKTTTLYAGLRMVNRPEINIVTVENPVEYPIAGVSQMEVDPAGKVTFAKALRSILRHDPDVLMIGEIRDTETAQIALRAAMTGHMVYSTLHTNTACGAVTRLVDMGCEPFLVASTLTAALAQRLVRRLCPGCKAERAAGSDEKALLGVAHDLTVFDPRGCVRCRGTGFLGRVAVFEMLEMDRAVHRAILGRADEEEIAEKAERLTLLRDDAIAKVKAGLTSVDEIRRVLILGDA